MRLTGLMIVRNEDWILGLSLRVAMKWLDQIVVVDHSSTDATYNIINQVTGEYPYRVHYSRWTDTKTVKMANSFDGEIRDVQVPDPEAYWDEMTVRQHSLEVGRKFGGTHYAIVDADEIPTANILKDLRYQIDCLPPGNCLDVPMLAMRTLDKYQDDDTVWSKAWITVGFCDKPGLTWKPAEDGYHHHHRKPYGVDDPSIRYLTDKKDGGIMHFQFANKRRLLAKHVYYRMFEHLRWPGRMAPEELNHKYDAALFEPATMSKLPEEFMQGYDKALINLNGYAYQEGEIKRLLVRHKREAFAGLDLKTF